MPAKKKPKKQEPNTVRLADLSISAMVAGNENKYSVVVHGDARKRWVGIGWVTEELATDEDRKRYPTVVD